MEKSYKKVKLKYLVIPLIFLLIFSAIYFSLPYLFPTKGETQLSAVIEYSMDNITYTESLRNVSGETLYSRLNIAEISGLSGQKINVSWSVIRAIDKDDFTTYNIPLNHIQLNILLESAPQIIFCPTDWLPYVNTANHFRIDAVCYRGGWQKTFTGQWFSVFLS